jgi:hypothetical protein
MAHITLDEANAWLEPTKLALTAIDENLEHQVVSLIYGRLAPVFNTSSWVNSAGTPEIIRTIIAMHYIAWTYDKFYSDDAEANAYAQTLRAVADANLQALLNGDVELVEQPTANDEIKKPSFFPNDISSANEPTPDRPSDGGPAFTMGSIF